MSVTPMNSSFQSKGPVPQLMLPKNQWRKRSTHSKDSISEESQPRPNAAEALFQWALKALSRKSFSTREIEAKLLARADDSSEVDSVLHRLAACGYLDDRKFIESFTAARLRRGPYSRSRLQRELAARGLPAELVNEVLETMVSPEDELAHLSRSLERKLQTWSGPMDEKKLARLYNFLLGQGFFQEAVRQEFRKRFHQSFDWED